MRILVATFALFPIFAAAQDLGMYQNLGTYQITGGTFVGNNGSSTVTGSGFTATLSGYPVPYYGGGDMPVSGETDFSMAFSSPAGRDNGIYMGVAGLSVDGLVPTYYSFNPYLQESGELSTPLIDITESGIYTTSFTMSVDVGYGPAGATTPTGYVDFIGSGTMTVDVHANCAPPGPCGPLTIDAPDYTFAPELDPASLSGAVTLLCGGVLVLRGRRSRQPMS